MKVPCVANADIFCFLTSLKSTAIINASSCFWWMLCGKNLRCRRKSSYMFYPEVQKCLMIKTKYKWAKQKVPKGSLNKQIKDELYLINSENGCSSSAVCMKHGFHFPFNSKVFLPQGKHIALNNYSSFILPSLPPTQNLLKTKLSASLVLKFVLLHFHTSWKIWNGAVSRSRQM